MSSRGWSLESLGTLLFRTFRLSSLPGVVRLSGLAALALVASAPPPGAEDAPGPTGRIETAGPSVRPGVRERVHSSVVGVRVVLPMPRISFTGRRRIVAQITPSEGTGSGVIVDASGLILTCAHVIDGAGRVQIYLGDDRVVEGTVTARDPAGDLALVKVETGPLPPLDLGGAGPLHQGQRVYLVSRPGGTVQRFVEASLSAPGAYHVGHSALEFFRQFLGQVEPGDSGGVLVDDAGRFLGVVSVGLPDGKLGYAIAREFVMVALSRLRAGAPIVWPWLGLAVGSHSKLPGALVWAVVPGSPADAAGISVGDRIVTIDGRTVEHFLPAMLTIASRPIGSSFALGIGEPPGRTVSVLSEPRSIDPPLPGLDLFERETGIRLEPYAAPGGRPGGLRIAGFSQNATSPMRGCVIGSRLISIVPGLGLVRQLEEGKTDQEILIVTPEQLGAALRASFVGDRVAAALVWETDGKRRTTFLTGDAKRYPIL